MNDYILTDKDVTPVRVDSFISDTGCYGSVSLVQVSGGAICVAKRLHDILIGYGVNEAVSERERQNLEEKFRKECITLSRLRHPSL